MTTPVDSASVVAFETSKPSRKFSRYQGQKNAPGLYWSATDNAMLGFESWLEAKWMTLLDFDPSVAAIASQPFSIEAIDDDTPWQHWPDLFVRLRDGSGRVIDVKDPGRIDDARVQLQARRTAEVCTEIGFEYELVTEPNPVLWANVECLAGFRRALSLPEGLTEEILALAQRPQPIGWVASQFAFPELARAAVKHLCWHRRLVVDLTIPIGDSSLVCDPCQEVT